MGRTGVRVVASPSRSTIIRSSTNVDKADIDGLTPARQRLGRCGILAGSISLEQALQDFLRMAVWCLFAERLLQSTVVGWGQSGRVGPLEQVMRRITSRGRAVFLLAVGAIGGVRLSGRSRSCLSVEDIPGMP